MDSKKTRIVWLSCAALLGCAEAPPPPPLAPPKGADVVIVVNDGHDPGPIEPLVAPGKVTVIDFYAEWCPPCRDVDAHLYPIAEKRQDVAIRKINIVSWDTPVAEKRLGDVPQLPYLVIYGKNGAVVDRISGADLARLDRALDRGAR